MDIQPRKLSMSLGPWMDDLGDDLLIQLFHKVLYFKSLTIYKCVSKRWLSLIPPPSIKSYPRAFILVNKDDDKLNYISMHEEHKNIFKSRHFTSSFDYLPIEEAKGISIAGTWGDIILCYGTNMGMYLCNPLTKQWFPIPRFRHDITIDDQRQGFAAGFVMQRDKFRVVLGARSQFAIAKSMSNLKLHMFCSETKQWRDLVIFYPQGFNNVAYGKMFHIQGIICNGMMHLRHWQFDRFIAFEPFKVPVNNTNANTSIIDITDQCHFIYMPCMIGLLPHMTGKLVESEKRVVCISMKIANVSNKRVEVRELKDYKANGVWKLIHQVQFSQMVSKDESINNLLKQLASFGGTSKTCTSYLVSMDTINKDIMYMILNDELHYKLVSCHLPTKTVSFIRIETFLTTRAAYDSCAMLGQYVFVLPWKPTPLPTPTIKQP